MRYMNFLCLNYGLIGVFVMSNPPCPHNIKTCYNCEVMSSCVLGGNVVSFVTEEECMVRLSSEVVWSVEYDSLTGMCRPSSCDDHIGYKEGSVVHRKTCDTECGDFTLTMSTGYQVSSSITYDFYHHGMSLISCLSVCLETNSSCTIMYEEENIDCWVYNSCLDMCAIENGQGSEVHVHKRQCEPEGTTNLALNKPTSMSSLWTDWGEPHIYRSPLGVDGDTTQDKYADTCFVTDGEVRPWWRVDLGAAYRIHRVVIYNRLDSNSDRAHDLVLYVGVAELDLAVQYYLPSLFSTYPFTFVSATVAQFVQLEINATFSEYFHLCEVQVYGVPECGSLPNPANGSVFTTDTTLDHFAEYTCSTGFILSGNSARKCQSNGTWTGIAPTCELVGCGPLSSPANGTVSLSGSTYMSTATYSCFTGFSLTGSVSRVCMSDGNWNSSAPSCNLVDCGELSSPANGIVSLSGSTYMSAATYSCFTGFSLTGSVSRMCMSDGNWNSSAPSCNLVDCGELSSPANGTVSLSGSTYMSTATYSCFTGFSLTGSVSRMCMSDGNWNSSAPSCNLVDCGELSSPANGIVSLSVSTYMSAATYSCFTGFSLTGSVSRMCMSDGNWNSSAPSCNLVDCGELPSPENGTVSLSGSTYMSTATYSCFTGFSLTGSVSRMCMSDENWNSSAPSCNLVDCGELSSPANGTVSLSGSTYMSTATYSCFTGFSLTGSVSRMCMSDGNWNSSAPSCNLVDCGELQGLANGTVSLSVSTYMSTATYSCFTGFSLTGSVSRICMPDGNWNSSAPSCNLVDCGELSSPANGTVSLSGSTYMSTATYSCFTGFSLTGSVSRMCMSDGNWNSSAPSCNLVDCGELSSPANGTVSLSGSTYMSTATYSCFTGFSLTGSVSRMCMSDGNWNSSAPSCNLVDCGELSSLANGTVSLSVSTYMSTATYSCFTGFSLTGSVSRICMPDGNWNSSAPSCNLVDCGDLSSPANGTVSLSGSTYMSTATYSCFTGFSLTGSVSRMCMSDGNWNSSAPACNLVDCGELSSPANGAVSLSGSTYMSTATYSCFTGFSSTGSVSRMCMSDGNWNSSAPSCNLVDCGELSSLANGTVSLSVSTYMSTATYSCFTGFSLTGSVSRICMPDGNWNSSAPSCNLVDCGDLSSPANGTVSLSGSTYMSTATYSCFTGFSLTGSVFRMCMSDGNWNSSAPSCNLVDCGELSSPANGTVSLSGSTYMSSATYSCFTGFSLTGPVLRMCMSDRNWNSSAPSCNLVDCGELPSPENGTVSLSGSTYMSIATYSCFTGFSMNGPVLRICISDGNWNSSAPSCSLVDCGELSSPANGTVSLSGSTYMSTATYSCFTGFNLTGSVLRMCMSDGNWNSSAPSCNLVDCGELPSPANGTVSLSGSTYMSTATYSCFTGFSMNGPILRICMSDGNWNSSDPSCSALTSVTPNAVTFEPFTSTLSSSTSLSNPPRIYIMSCICYPNKTFTGMTQEEIISKLIAETEINPKNTALSKAKLISRNDSRKSSKIMGTVGASVLSTVLGLIISSDLVTLLMKLKSVCKANNVVATI